MLKSNLLFKGALSGVRHFLATENQLEMMKNGYFISPKNFFSFLTYLTFGLTVLILYENDLIKKLKLISKFTAS